LQYDLASPEGYCEYQLYKITHIPGMLFISKNGNIVEVTEQVIQKPELKQKLESLLTK